MKFIFFNENDRLRSGWRALIFIITYFLLSFVFIAAEILLLAGSPIGPSVGSQIPISLVFATATIVAIVLGWAYGKVFERLPFITLGISFRDKWLLHLFAGLFLGAAALCSALIVAMIGGGIKLTLNIDSPRSAIWSTLSLSLIVFTLGALSEETFFRGYALQTLVRSHQVIAGIVITSFLFLLMHSGNPSVASFPLFNTFLAGIWFAVAYLKTRDLWFPFGMHLMWNWLQGPVFGINVSGVSEFSPDPVMRAIDAGPAWLTGGNYGIEGGLACTFALILFTVVVYLLPWPGPTAEMLALTSTEKLGGLDLK